MLSELYIAIAAAVIAYVYTGILTEPQNIFFRWFLFVRRITLPPVEGCQRAHYPLWRIVAFKLIIECDTCLAGQSALWWFLIKHRSDYNWSIVVDHIFITCSAIFLTYVVKKIHRFCLS